MDKDIDFSAVIALHKLDLLYEKFPEDVVIAAKDAARFAAALVDDLDPSDEPWPPMMARMEP